MKKNVFLTIVLLVIAIYSTNAQVTLPHYEGFDYNVGDSLPMHGWIGYNSGDQILVTAGSLSYSGLLASVGNKVSFDGLGRDFQMTVASQTAGTVYMSFIMQVTALGSLNATGGYFTGFGSSSTTFGSTVWLKLTGSGYSIGINPRTTTANTVFDATEIALNTPVFVVVSYEFVTGATNDIAKIWINPSASSFGGVTVPTPTLTAANTIADLTEIERIFLRQDSDTETPFVDVDEIRLGTAWADVTPTGVGIIENTNIHDFQLSPNPSNGKFNIIMNSKGVSYGVKIFNTLGNVVYNQNNINSNTAIDLSSLSKGIYFVQVRNNDSFMISSEKMVIQ